MITKHPLLPETYTDASLQSTLLAALAPYIKTADSQNPQFRWDLPAAWADAKELLLGARWRLHHEQWELAADTDEEIRDLHAIAAGIVARQLEDPNGSLDLRRIEFRKGGEVALVISDEVQAHLAKLFPNAHYAQAGENAARQKEGKITRKIKTFAARLQGALKK